MDRVHSNDKTSLITKQFCFSALILNYAGLFFDLEKGQFRSYFSWEMPQSNPVYVFRKRLLNFGRQMAELGGDVSEVALMFALNTVCLG
jgi:hypothetical protein